MRNFKCFKNLNPIERLHDDHIGVPKQWNNPVGVELFSYVNAFLCGAAGVFQS